MWILAILLLVVITVALTLTAARKNRQENKFLPWDIPRVSSTYTTIVGSLSGFAVASSIFVANLRVNQQSPQFEPVIILFLTAFVIFIGTAMLFANVPNHSDLKSERSQPGSTQSVVYALACINFYLGVSSLWFALRPLLLAIDLPIVASIFTWILLFIAIAGATSLGMVIYYMTRFGRRIIFLIPIVGFGFATLYRKAFTPFVPDMWPSENPALAFIMVQFVVAGIVFSASYLYLLSMSSKRSTKSTRHTRENQLLAMAQAATCSVALLWWAVVSP